MIPSLGARRSVRNLNRCSTGSTVHADLPSPKSSDVSFVSLYLRARMTRRSQSVCEKNSAVGPRQSLGRQKRGESRERRRARGAVRGGRAPRAVARDIGVADARVRGLDVLVRVRDIRGLHGEVIDQHGSRSADLASRPFCVLRVVRGRRGKGQRHAA